MTELKQMIKQMEAAGYRCGYAITEAEARADGCDLLFDRTGHYRALTLKGMALLDVQRQIITAAKELVLEFTPEEIAAAWAPAESLPPGAIDRIGEMSGLPSVPASHPAQEAQEIDIDKRIGIVKS